MQRKSKLRSESKVARTTPEHLRLLRTLLLGATAALACSSLAPRADASIGEPNPIDPRWMQRYTTALQRTNPDQSLSRVELSDQEKPAFSGVGLMVCSADGESRTSTAFLVGAFDLAVTVAHTFAPNANGAQPECVYNTMDSLGQVRERIPVAYVKSQWSADADAAQQPANDLAVVRLTQPSRYAQRTMPLGRFSGAAAPVVMVGYKADAEVDTVKRKARGTVYGRRASDAKLAGFMHDMDARGIAAGAPVMDERSGVIIGIHAPLAARRNTMITMNDWLEATLRDEMALAQQAGAKVNP